MYLRFVFFILDFILIYDVFNHIYMMLRVIRCKRWKGMLCNLGIYTNTDLLMGSWKLYFPGIFVCRVELIAHPLLG